MIGIFIGDDAQSSMSTVITKSIPRVFHPDAVPSSQP